MGFCQPKWPHATTTGRGFSFGDLPNQPPRRQIPGHQIFHRHGIPGEQIRHSAFRAKIFGRFDERGQSLLVAFHQRLRNGYFGDIAVFAIHQPQVALHIGIQFRGREQVDDIHIHIFRDQYRKAD